MFKYIGYGLLAIVLVLLGYYLVISQTTSAPRDQQLAVRGEFIDYADGTRGYYAQPADEGEYPGVVMVHEWWGLNDTIAGAAEELAAEGYRVLAVDLFGVVASSSAQARALTSGLDQAAAIQNMKSAEAFLRNEDTSRIGVLGWCFGGGQALQLALSENEELDATVIYYGQLTDDVERLRNISWPVLGIFGEEDTSIPVASVQAFQGALATAGVEHEIHTYTGVGHAFANPSNDNYAPKETADAWEKTLAFLEKHLK